MHLSPPPPPPRLRLWSVLRRWFCCCLFIVTPIVGVCNCSMFCCMLLYVRSSIAIILMGKSELVALLNLSSWCLMMVERLFLVVPRGCLQFVIVVFPDHTHLLFLFVLAYELLFNADIGQSVKILLRFTYFECGCLEEKIHPYRTGAVSHTPTGEGLSHAYRVRL